MKKISIKSYFVWPQNVLLFLSRVHRWSRLCIGVSQHVTRLLLLATWCRAPMQVEGRIRTTVFGGRTESTSGPSKDPRSQEGIIPSSHRPYRSMSFARTTYSLPSTRAMRWQTSCPCPNMYICTVYIFMQLCAARYGPGACISLCSAHNL